MTIAEKINEELKKAILSKNQVRMNTLRMLKSKILAADARGNLPDAEVIKLFKTYFGNLQEAKEQAASRPELVATLVEELAIVQEFLPKAPSREETEKLVIQAIKESGATMKKELGLVMKKIMQLNSAIDGKLAKEIADRHLQ